MSYSLRMRATIGSIYWWFIIMWFRSIVILIFHSCNAGFIHYIYCNILIADFNYHIYRNIIIADFNYYIYCNIFIPITVTLVSIIIYMGPRFVYLRVCNTIGVTNEAGTLLSWTHVDAYYIVIVNLKCSVEIFVILLYS